jgi:outer membrane protein assembly factor BamB
VRTPPTTICCSALALILLSGGAPAAQAPRSWSPADALALFPVRAAWTIALNSSLIGQPAFDGSRGYLPIEGDRLVAYDLVHGERLWITETAAITSIVAAGDLVFTAGPDTVVARRSEDGAEVWRLRLEPLDRFAAWENGRLVVPTESGALLALRALDGRQLWRRELAARVSAAPTFGANHMYVPLADRRVVALRIETGEPVWETRLGGLPGEGRAFDDRLYIGADDNFLYCLKVDRGQIDWRWRTGADLLGKPVVDESRVYFLSLDNVLRGHNRRSGAQQWKRALPMRPRSGPVEAGDALIVSGIGSAVRAYLKSNGAPAGEIAAPGELGSSAEVVGEASLPTLVMVTSDVAKGATVAAFTRAIEPAVQPVTPLPNPIMPPSIDASGASASPPAPSALP